MLFRSRTGPRGAQILSPWYDNFLIDLGSAQELVHILFAKCSVLFSTSGSAKRLVHLLFAKYPAFGIFSNRLSKVIF